VQGTNASRTVCRASSSLTAELGRAHTREALTAKITGWNSEKGTAEQRHADRREKLQTAMDKAAADLTAAKPMKQANSDAAALVGYLAAIGVNATPDTVNKWLVILAVLVVEMGGGLSLAIGMALSDSGVRSGQADRANVQVEQSVNEQPAERPNTAPERTVKNTSLVNTIVQVPTLNERRSNAAHERVLSALRAKDGVLFGSQVALGRAFGWSKTRANEVLHQLQDAGRVRLSTSSQGTMVRLVAGAA
jgi:hypothetical protein